MALLLIDSRRKFKLQHEYSSSSYSASTFPGSCSSRSATRKLTLRTSRCVDSLLSAPSSPLTYPHPAQFLKQANGLDLGKMIDAFRVYNKVVRDKLSVTDGSVALDELFVEPPKYKLWQQLIIGGLASAFIIPSAFYGSFIDCLAAIPLGALLVLVQVVASRNDLYSSLFE